MAEAASITPSRVRGALHRKRAVSVLTATALAFGGALLAPLAAQAAEQPSFTADVTEVANDRIDVAIEGDGYGDVQALPGQTEPHAYFTLVEQGADLSEVGQADTAISAEVEPDGTVSDVLSVPADELVDGTSYEVISWPSRSFPTEENLYARTDITIDWAALFPEEAPVFEPSLSVDPATDLNPEGDTVTLTGTGYNPAQGIYVFLCGDVDLPADLWTLALGCREGAAVVYPSDDTTDGRTTFDEDGAFELEFDVQQLDEGATSVFTAANHTAATDRGQDAKAALAFAEALPEPAQPTFTADVTEKADEGIDVAIEGSGYDDVQALPGQTEPHAYFTLVEQGADLSDVSQTDTAISASIEADGTLSDVLSVPAEELVSGTSYEVISWPSRSNPSEENLYARADITIDWAALFPAEEEPGEEEPDAVTFAITDADGESVTSVTQGDDIGFAVSPVEVGAEFAVTVESDPVTLPAVIADADGVASTTWTVPGDFETGDHTVTFASADGAVSHSAEFEVLAAEDTTPDDGAADADSDDGATDADSNDGATDAGSDESNGSGSVDGGTTNDDEGDGALAVTGADAPFALVGIAGVLTLLGAAVLVAGRRAAVGSAR
ncbi:hypothetical protein [Microbacterium halotolerans]|uniref:hypothetical protein n=1 Tax=Microbacterium halotolerans TaxID=246613 RepID=UPI000E6ADE87|nr:hypothetical protein [Microbacterium halotolerans]